jgi:hypothetical protein
VVAGNESDGSTSKFSAFDDSGSSVLWMEESSDEGLDYFAALDVAEAEASPRVRMLKFCLVRVLGVGGEGRWRSVE